MICPRCGADMSRDPSKLACVGVIAGTGGFVFMAPQHACLCVYEDEEDGDAIATGVCCRGGHGTIGAAITVGGLSDDEQVLSDAIFARAEDLCRDSLKTPIDPDAPIMLTVDYAHDESRLLHEAVKMLRDALPWIATDIWNDGREAKDGQAQADPVQLCAAIETFLEENE